MGRFFRELVRPGMSGPRDYLLALCLANEFEELPVRHNEDAYNEQLAAHVRFRPGAAEFPAVACAPAAANEDGESCTAKRARPAAAGA